MVLTVYTNTQQISNNRQILYMLANLTVLQPPHQPKQRMETEMQMINYASHLLLTSSGMRQPNNTTLAVRYVLKNQSLSVVMVFQAMAYLLVIWVSKMALDLKASKSATMEIMSTTMDVQTAKLILAMNAQLGEFHAIRSVETDTLKRKQMALWSQLRSVKDLMSSKPNNVILVQTST